MGGLFPDFVNSSIPATQEFASYLLPTAPKDYALLFFWSFIAGFAEQFVPDALNHFISRGQEAIKIAPSPKPTVPTPPPDNVNEGSEPNKPEDKKANPQAEANENDDDLDGCDVEANKIDITPDEALPPAEGGVAK